MSGPNTDYDPVEVTPLKAEEVEAARDAALAAIAAASDLEALKQVRLEHAGDRSALALANREIGALPPQARKEAGQRVGQARGAVNRAIAERQAVLEVEHEERMLVEETVDVTLPTERVARGARHPITTGSERIADVFLAMGWEVAEGPVIEAEWLNFDALNLGADHPARTMQDTFWAEPAGHGMVLRTHTSPVQARTMLDPRAPDLRRVSRAGLPHRRVRRHAQPDVPPGRGPRRRRGHLDGPPQGHARPLRRRHVRRGDHHPLPAVVLPVHRAQRRGRPGLLRVPRRVRRGATSRPCRTCRGEGWIEWGGCGIVNPRVLTACGVDAERYTGFAFGMGIDRTLMFRHGIEDLRGFFEGDVRFTTAFGTEI